MELSQKHKVFAEAIIEGLSPELAYSKAYPKSKPTSARVESYRLLQITTVANYIKEKSSRIEELATNKAIEALKDKIVSKVLTVEERKQILTDIALGKVQYKTYEVIQNENEDTGEITFGTKPITVAEPMIGDRIRAISELSRMGGDYAPTKVAQTDSEGKDLKQIDYSKLSKDALKELLNAATGS
jgi:hypothetical protein